MTMNVIPSRITPCTTSMAMSPQSPPRKLWIITIVPISSTMSVMSMPMTGAKSLQVDASCTPADRMKFVAMTNPMNCCVVML